MNYYVYKTQGVTITIQAPDAAYSFRLLTERIIELNDMGVRVPDALEFEMVSRF